MGLEKKDSEAGSRSLRNGGGGVGEQGEIQVRGVNVGMICTNFRRIKQIDQQSWKGERRSIGIS